MTDFTIKDLVAITEGELISGNGAARVKGFSIDSRTIKTDELFIAVKGEHYDGHEFIAEALTKKASGLLVGNEFHHAGADASNIIRVKDTVGAMARIARRIRGMSDIPVICITGTNGKTTVKEILSAILSSKYNVLKSRKSYNNIIGLCLTLFDLDPSYEVAVLELGTNHFGEMSRLADIALPGIAVINNIGSGHLEFLNDREGVFREKMSLLGSMPGEGTVFLNRDDDMLAGADTGTLKKRYFGMSPGSDHLISDVRREGNGYGFRLNDEPFFMPIEGRHNVYNSAAAIAVAQRFGIEDDRIRDALRSVLLPEMRLERIEAGGITFINDAYNANPDSFERALDVLQESDASGRKGVVAGNMMELGSRSDVLHEEIGKSVAARGLDLLVTVGESARHIARGAEEKGMDPSSIFEAGDNKEAAELIRGIAAPGDVILLKGSRKAKMEEMLACFTTCFTR